MARTSLLDDVLDISVRLPLWANLAVATGSFLVLHHFGGSEFPAYPQHPYGPELGPLLAGYIGQVGAYAGQFLIPPCFVVGGIIGSAKRSIRARRFNRLSGANYSASAIRALTWREFEIYIGEAFRRRGFRVRSTPNGADGGVDLELFKDGDLHLVQCKHWKSRSVGVSVVREIYGVLMVRKASSAFVVTSGEFTAEAKAFAELAGVRLVDGGLLGQWLRDLKRDGFEMPQAGDSRHEVSEKEPAPRHRGSALDQPCPRCGDVMTPRFPSGGGKVFLGCTNYAHGCRGTRQLAAAPSDQ